MSFVFSNLRLPSLQNDWIRFSRKKSCLFWVDRRSYAGFRLLPCHYTMKEGEREPFFPKLRVRIKDNNSSPHGKFYRFLFPFSSKFSDLNFASYVLYIYLHTVSLGYLERLPFVNKNRKFRLETQMVQLIPSESFWKRWKSLELFLFSRSNRNDRKNPVPFLNSHSTRCTSASFPAI